MTKRLCRRVLVALAAVFVVVMFAMTGVVNAATGWVRNSKGWIYLKTDGTYAKSEWVKDNGKWYFFNKNGYMLTGWAKIQNKRYYFEPSGAMATGWKNIDEKAYYFNSSGAMVTGKKTISGREFYFSSSGALLIRGFNVEDVQDPYFRQYISENYDTNHDGKMGIKEIQAVTRMDLEGITYGGPGKGSVVHDISKIERLDDVNLFVNLKTLNISDLSLHILELSGLKLDNLYITGNANPLAISCSKDTAKRIVIDSLQLKEAKYPTNTLESLTLRNVKGNVKGNIRSCSNLKELTITNCGLEKLVFTELSKLTYLNLSNNAFTSLDLSALKNLLYMDCSRNSISKLDMSSCPKLTYLDCSGHEMDSINVSKNTKLVYLDCEVSSLSVENNPYLSYLVLNAKDTSVSDSHAYKKNLMYLCAGSEAKIKAGTEMKTLSGWVVRYGSGNTLLKCYYAKDTWATGWKKISGKWYYFRDSRYSYSAATDQFVKGYYLDEKGVYDESAQVSWHKTKDGRWWYGNSKWYAKGQSYTIDGKWYNFDEGGYMIEYDED